MPRVVRPGDTAPVLMSALETRATEGNGPTWVGSGRPRLQKRSVPQRIRDPCIQIMLHSGVQCSRSFLPGSFPGEGRETLVGPAFCDMSKPTSTTADDN